MSTRTELLLSVQRAGTGAVLVHGCLAGSIQWSAELERLGPHFDAIAADLAGCGEARTARRIRATRLPDARPRRRSSAGRSGCRREPAGGRGRVVCHGRLGRTRPKRRRTQVEGPWRVVPGASLAVLPACSHALHLERAALFHALVPEFLRAADRLPAGASV